MTEIKPHNSSWLFLCNNFRQYEFLSFFQWVRLSIDNLFGVKLAVIKKLGKERPSILA